MTKRKKRIDGSDRMTYLGSGDGAPIIGISQYRTSLDVYEAKTTPAPDGEKEVTGPMDRGILLEAPIIERFARRHSLTVTDLQAFKVRDDLPFPIGSHIDGRVKQDGALVEAKSAASGLRGLYGEPGSPDIPEDYSVQCAHHLFLHPDAPYVWVPVAFVGFRVDFIDFKVPRDNQFIKDLIDAETAFAEKHILPRIPPDPTTKAEVSRLFPRDAGTSVEATVELALAVNELSGLKAKYKGLEEEIELIEGKVAAGFGDAALLTYDGKVLASFKSQTRKTTDLKALLEAHPELAWQFIRETIFRVLRLTK